jgi:hypothetical protein
MPIDAEAIIAAVRDAMPQNAEIHVAPGLAHFNVIAAWKLNSAPERPNKMSKTISIEVTHEAAQDFASASAEVQSRSYERVARFISEKLQNFDPNHDTPRFEPPPVERWFVTSAVLVG